ncbi:peptidylprolyl isomerase [Stakelama saccharophila]|uniref:peptidylprolyl isomerase n=1 Tax=Stakelama saccharophila TaxID=3075605 RepID=A0ABZ0B7K6_9SPHN|nr:peptidylprolyl isomerase [Stakelama sp. W311]WNO53207.1 peptidylprolyl isomerase [Stakelama sp. W311]
MRFIAFLLALVAAMAAMPAAAQNQLFEVKGRKAAPGPDDKDNLWLLDLSTGGRVTILLRPDVAPNMVARVKTLTRDHFYDGTIFHRVMDSPVPIAQGGDPGGDGRGGSDLPDLKAEFNYLPHVRGAVSAARRGAPEGASEEQRTEAENSANSQFFIMFQPYLGFDRKYTVFGRVIDGMEYVDKIHRGQPPADPTRIVHAYIAADNPPPYSNAPAAAPSPAQQKDADIVLPGAGDGADAAGDPAAGKSDSD